MRLGLGRLSHGSGHCWKGMKVESYALMACERVGMGTWSAQELHEWSGVAGMEMVRNCRNGWELWEWRGWLGVAGMAGALHILTDQRHYLLQR